MKEITFTPLTDDLSLELKVSCKPGLMPMAGVTVSPSGCVMPEEFEIYAERLHNFDVREDDTWVISYPKCGTTWTQEMVWLIGNNCDFEAASKRLLLQRFPFLEAVSIIPQPEVDEKAQFLDEHVLFADTIEYVEEQVQPRFIKSHLPVALLPKQIWIKKPKVSWLTCCDASTTATITCTSCSEYVMTIGSTNYTYTCPTGTVCSTASSTSSTAAATSSSTTTAATTTTASSDICASTNACDGVVCNKYVVWGSSTSCQQYHVCRYISGYGTYVISTLTCPGSSTFDTSTNKCTLSSSATCFSST